MSASSSDTSLLQAVGPGRRSGRGGQYESPRLPADAAPPGQLDRALAVPVGHQRVQRGRALGAERRGAGAGWPRRRSTRVRTARGSSASAATSRPVPVDLGRTARSASRGRVVSGGQDGGGPGVEGGEVVAQQLGGAGQRRGHAALQHVLEQGQHLVPQPHPR